MQYFSYIYIYIAALTTFCLSVVGIDSDNLRLAEHIIAS